MLKSRYSYYCRNWGAVGSAWRDFGRSHAVELTAGAVLMLAVICLGLLFVRLSSGVSKVLAMPSHVVRLQVVNGTAAEVWSSRLIDRLASYRDADIEIQLVARDDSDIRQVRQSMVISRVEDDAAARLLAGKLGLDPASVFYKPLEHNRNHVSVTLLLGRDYERLTLDVSAEKENAN